MGANRGGNRLRQVGSKIVERRANGAAKPAWGEPPGRFVDRNDPANLERFCSLLLSAVVTGIGRIPEHFELRLNDLQLTAALVFFDLAIQRDHLAGHELILQIGGIEKE